MNKDVTAEEMVDLFIGDESEYKKMHELANNLRDRAEEMKELSNKIDNGCLMDDRFKKIISLIKEGYGCGACRYLDFDGYGDQYCSLTNKPRYDICGGWVLDTDLESASWFNDVDDIAEFFSQLTLDNEEMEVGNGTEN